MKQFCIFLSIFFLFLACATKQKVKEIKNVKIETENLIKFDSISELKTIQSKTEKIEEYNKIENDFNELFIQYDGSQSDNLSILVNRNSEKTEFNITGKGKVSFNQNKLKDVKSNIYKNSLDTIYEHTVNLEQEKLINQKSTFNSDQKKNEKTTKGIQFGFYLLIFGIIICFLFAYIFIRFFNNK